jgi:hypothetical protein
VALRGRRRAHQQEDSNSNGVSAHVLSFADQQQKRLDDDTTAFICQEA